MVKKVSNRSVPDYAQFGHDVDGYGAMWTRSTPMGYRRGDYRRGGYRVGYLPHRLAQILSARADSIVQVIYSYGTPIAWLDAGAWVVPDVRYSGTTGKHQGYLWPLAGRLDIPADVSITGYLRILNGQDRYSHGRLTSPAATSPLFR